MDCPITGFDCITCDTACSLRDKVTTADQGRSEGHYWVRFGTSENWDVMYWRDGHFWDHNDAGYRPENFEIGHQVFPPNVN